ncbi:Mu transposase C-terminal domain-containing protein [Parageobacillus thermoglucosidasius]|jgi:Mu transposase, C-terminal/Integrase core domain|uniref:Mu transposase C-terminal domain-containing protein n=1 Tax=Parageobacillus thermoglucosidasius TaxID=1426 RepID=UPI001FCA81A9|nr:Mu transposase C-terminal domain-containing protein [Parageobacillus thermoglucosidasius]BDG30459.1 transposase [Parageobacillus thermoglucosidasius]
MYFSENQLIQIKVNESTVVERILWIDPGNIICFTINIYEDNPLPLKRTISDLENMLNDGCLSFINDEPFRIYFRDDELSEKEIRIREKRWNIIKDVVCVEPDIYDSFRRGQIVKSLLSNKSSNYASIYKFLRLYWIRGKTKNALLPDYKNSGGRGKSKTLGDKKIGRPRKYKSVEGEGVNITDEIKRIIQISLKKYYFNSKQMTLRDSYNQMLEEFFKEDIYYDNGFKKVILKDKSELPTYKQYLYWYTKLFNSEEKTINKKGKRKYLLEDRAVLGSSYYDNLGPGWKYQIDATVADVYLVSELNREWIIGKPVVYFVEDVFSRMIVGMYVGLEGPSWLGAMMALINTASNKVEFCKQYDIDISYDKWPCQHLPSTLVADRGELEGYNIEPLINAFNVSVENTPPYRADLKGIVEQHFRLTNSRVKPFVPGTIDKDFRVRGGRDYRLDAKLTLKEFTQIMIHCILYHNNHHWLKNYNPDEMLIRDEVPLIPVRLWEWGLKNRAGQLRAFPEDVVKLQLLPRKKASITARGIHFGKNVYYSCERAIKEGWFAEASIKGKWTVNIAYDPRQMEYIYIVNSDGSYEVCKLLDQYKHYGSKSIEEFEYIKNYEQMMQVKNEKEVTEHKIDLDSTIKAIVEKAKNDNNVSTNKSKAERLRNIKNNRDIEKQRIRKEEAILLGEAREREGNLKEHNWNLQVEVRRDNNSNSENSDKKISDLIRKVQKSKKSNFMRG